MKRLFLILLCVPLFWACGDSDDDTSNTEKTITYKFNSKAAPTGTNNLIGVQIYKGTKTAASTGNLVQYAPYAYGIFDDFSKIKLELPKGSEYKIVSTVVVDGKNKVVQDGNGYLKPFSIQDKGVALTNAFTLSSDKAMTLLNQSTTTLIKNTSKSTKDSPSNTYEPEDVAVPRLDRYYGEVTEYNGDSNTNPVVNMGRQVFGIRFTVEFEGNKIEPEDCLYLAVKGATDTLFIHAKDEVKTIEAMYTFSNFVDNVPPSIEIDVYHRLPDGTERYMEGTSGWTLYRNYLMILDHKVILDDTGNSYPYRFEGIEDYYGDGGY